MLTYLKLDEELLDLSGLNEEERAYFDGCYAAYRAGMEWATFANTLLNSPENPVLRTANGRITRLAYNHPLYQALHDLSDRLGIRQGIIGPEPGDDVDADPIAEEWLPAAAAAIAKGVSYSGLNQAIKRGDVIFYAERPESARPGYMVSRRSLDRWEPQHGRQLAGAQVRRRTGGARRSS